MVRNKFGFYYSAKQHFFGVMDDYGNPIDLSDDSFDSALYYVHS